MTRWNDHETKAPACGQGFRAASSVGWMGGATDGPRIGSTEQLAKGSISVARQPPPVTTGSVRIATLLQTRIAGHFSAYGMPNDTGVIFSACGPTR